MRRGTISKLSQRIGVPRNTLYDWKSKIVRDPTWRPDHYQKKNFALFPFHEQKIAQEIQRRINRNEHLSINRVRMIIRNLIKLFL